MPIYSVVDSAPVALAPSGHAYHRRILVTTTPGSLGSFSGLATPTVTSVTPQGAAGATTYGYKVVALLGNGTQTAASPEVTTATGNAVLSGTDFNRIVWGAVAGAATYKLYRTTGGSNPYLIYSGALLTYDDVLKTSGTPETPSSANGTATLPYLDSPINSDVKLWPKAVCLGVEAAATGTVYITFDGQSIPSATLGFVIPALPGYIRVPCPDGLTLDSLKVVATVNPTALQLYAEFGG